MLDTDELVLRYAVPERETPHLRVNFISSLDGAATHDGLTAGLNNADDKQVFDTLRMLSDAVLVGAGTLRQEGYGAMVLDAPAVAWRTARRLPAHPTLAVVSGRLDLDPRSPLFAEAPVRPLVLTHAGAPRDRRRALAAVADVVVCGDDAVDPHRAARELTRRGLTQVLCEGGPHLLGTLVAADLVDELCLTLSPVLEGGHAGRITAGGAQVTRPMRLAHVLTAGDLLLLRYLRAR
ncbi:pyrimidine reductase family protein [Georgenia thermotolerans]|uniref:Pyrimidine reductase family protein n=1 Tax=Georgenia thermotolerans TaxID=527326 RepID=A0A7J5ULI7_9MICO|nr:pyrimidine reductase family protein [Georgenia thermotolerans]KAE8763237.1 pyrimidine reductase family protein [Georgenia thermotolerans]